MTARIGVVTFPGSLDDRDTQRAVRLAGAEPVALWHRDKDLQQVDAVVLPGGFSLRRLSARRRHLAFLAGDGDRHRAGEGRHAGPRHLQRLPGPDRVASAAGRDARATTTCTSSAATRSCGWRTRTPPGPSDYDGRPGDLRPAEERRRPLRRRRAHARRAGGRGPRRLPLRRRQPERLAARHRRHHQRRRATSSASCRTPSTPSSR